MPVKPAGWTFDYAPGKTEARSVYGITLVAHRNGVAISPKSFGGIIACGESACSPQARPWRPHRRGHYCELFGYTQ